MRKITLLIAVVAALSLGVFMFAGCSSSSDDESTTTEESTSTDATSNESSDSTKDDESATTDDDSADIDTLIVGYDSSYPPYGYIGDDGEPTGFDLDLAADVADRNGWDVEYTAIDWDAKDAMLNQGTINCIWNGFTMEGREGEYTFSDPYMLNEQVVVVKADSDIKSLDDLADKTVVTQIDSAAEEVLEDDKADLTHTFAELRTISDYNNAFMELESGLADAVACDLSIAAYQMAANPDSYVQLDESLSSEHYAVGFKLGDQALADTVTDSLKDLYEDGTVEKLCDKYADDGISIDNWVLK